MMKKVLLTRFFKIKSGDYHAISELDNGKTPLISCGESDNGLVGNFQIDANTEHSNAITVAYNGLPLTSKFHPYKFGAKDDVGVLIPKTQMMDSTLIYVASMLSLQRWRYSYGRKCFKGKLEHLEIEIPLKEDESIDEDYIQRILPKTVQSYVPSTKPKRFSVPDKVIWQENELSKIFEIEVGSIHKTESLDEGKIPLISCSELENGITGYFDITEENIFQNALTVSFDGKPLTVKYHNYKFATYDNVGVLVPKKELQETTLFFIAGQISLQQWRYSYGRKCYQAKIKKLVIKLPIDNDGEIDEDTIKALVETVPYSDFVLS